MNNITALKFDFIQLFFVNLMFLNENGEYFTNDFIPSWASPWVSQPREGLFTKSLSTTPLKRSTREYGRMPFRFRLYKTEDPVLNDVMEKRSLNPANWFRFNPDTEDTLLGLNYVPMLGKRMFASE